MERGYVGDRPELPVALAQLQCVTEKKLQALSNQIEIIFLNNQLESLKRGDLREDIGAGLTQYDVESRMRDARKEVEELLAQIKDGTCG
jgi:hypothetical protein